MIAKDKEKKEKEILVKFNDELDILKTNVNLLGKMVISLISFKELMMGKEDINLAAAIAKSQSASEAIVAQNNKIDKIMNLFLDENGAMTPISKIIDNKLSPIRLEINSINKKLNEHLSLEKV